MGTISRMFTQTATTERETFVSGSDIKKEYTAHLTSFSCHIQPLEAELAQALPGGFGKNWLMFCSNRDIREGDKVISGGTEYKVAGIETYTMSRNPHQEVILRAFKNG